MVNCTGRGLVVKRPGVLSKVQMLNLVLGVEVFSLLPRIFRPSGTDFARLIFCLVSLKDKRRICDGFSEFASVASDGERTKYIWGGGGEIHFFKIDDQNPRRAPGETCCPKLVSCSLFSMLIGEDFKDFRPKISRKALHSTN